MFTLHSIGCLNAVLLKLYACEVKKIFLQFSYPSFYWLRGVCPGCHVGHACGHSLVLSCSRVRVLRGIARWRVVALWSFLSVLSVGCGSGSMRLNVGRGPAKDLLRFGVSGGVKLG